MEEGLMLRLDLTLQICNLECSGDHGVVVDSLVGISCF